MKKLLAFLLALMLPLCAAAETYGFSFRMDTDETNFKNAVQTDLVNNGADAAAAEKQAELMQKLVDGMGMQFKCEDNAFQLVFQLCGSQLFDLTAYEKDGMALITSSMLDGYALAESAEREESALSQASWDAAAQHITETLENWCAGIEKTEMYGVFVGDAFEGGTKCITWALDDKALSRLVDEILTEDVREVLNAAFEEMGLEAADVLETIAKANSEAATNNRYVYILRAVENEDKLAGLSLTVMQGEAQAATVSIGFKADGIKAVIGLGLEKQNYWCEIAGTWTDTENGKSIIATIREWAAAKDEAFAYVQGAAAPANSIEWTFDMHSDDAGYIWYSALKSKSEVLLTANGTAKPSEKTYDGIIMLGSEAKPLVKITFSACPTEVIPAMDASLVICSMSDPGDAELYEKLNNQLVAAISARLLKILPMDLILQMAQ